VLALRDRRAPAFSVLGVRAITHPILSAARNGPATRSYTYDALNRRVKTVTSSATTEYVYNAAGQRVSEWNTSQAQLKGHYYWGATPVAYYTTANDGGAAAHFEHQDWLGTERMRTSYSGGSEATFTSLPWGDSQTTATGADGDANHYATLDYDSETNTDHAEFRQYSPTQGRWLSPDPYGGSYDMSNPQSFNRYEYAMNNPLSNIDHNGLECVFMDELGNSVEEVDATGDGYTESDCANDGGYYFNGNNDLDSSDWGRFDADPDSNWVGLTDDNGNPQQAACVGGSSSPGGSCSFGALSDMGTDYASDVVNYGLQSNVAPSNSLVAGLALFMPMSPGWGRQINDQMCSMALKICVFDVEFMKNFTSGIPGDVGTGISIVTTSDQTEQIGLKVCQARYVNCMN